MEEHLDDLAGGLQLGADLAEARTAAQARRRAERIFSIVLRQPALSVVVPEGSPPAVDRDALVAWAYGRKASTTTPRATEIFTFGPVVTADQFVKVVERAYKEQRLLTAGVASFDALSTSVSRAVKLLACCLMLIILLEIYEVPTSAWLVPLGTGIVTVALLAGSITSDFFESFYYAYITRPYDIGDRVLLSSPGSDPTMASLVVKNVFLVRTEFMNIAGQSLLINHSALNRMSISNLNKSGRMTMLFVLRVPVVTPVAKITSLCEAIKAYATEAATEWAAFDLLFDDIVNNEGHLSLKIWAESRFLAHEVVPIYEAKSRLVLFTHTYMQAASIDYVQPLLPTARVA